MSKYWAITLTYENDETWFRLSYYDKEKEKLVRSGTLPNIIGFAFCNGGKIHLSEECRNNH